MIQFTQPWALWGLFGITLPLAAHFFSRKLPEIYNFSSIRFISPGTAPYQRQKKLSDILLLLIRCLCIVAIVLAFSGIRWSGKDATVTDQNIEDLQTYIVVVDGSASMNGKGKWDEVKNWIENILFERSVQVKLIIFSEQVINESNLITNSHEAITYLNDHAPGYGRFDPMGALQNVYKSENIPENSDLKIWILSDFQKTDWQEFWNSPYQGRLPSYYHLIKGRVEDNSAILSAHLSPQKDKLRISGLVKNYTGNQSLRKIVLEIDADTDSLSQDIELGPYKTEQFSFILPKYAEKKARIHFHKPDDYQLDDTWHFWLHQPAPENILFRSSVLADDIDMQEIMFIKNAIESSGENIWYRFNVIDKDYISNKDLSDDVWAVMWPSFSDNVLSHDTAVLLKDYMRQGGKVFITLFERAAENLKRLNNAGIFDGSFQGVKSVSAEQAFQRIADINGNDPLRSYLKKELEKDLLSSRLFQQVLLKSKDKYTTILETIEGYPVLIKKNIGHGHLFIFLTRLHPLYWDVPLKMSFVPLLHELLRARTNRELNTDKEKRTDIANYLNPPGCVRDKTGLRAFNVSKYESQPESYSETFLRGHAYKGEFEEGEGSLAEQRLDWYLNPLFLVIGIGLFILECVTSVTREVNNESCT
ncbi:MAG: BatA domain-containing protein [Candidatus Anammoxibacter sp.]